MSAHSPRRLQAAALLFLPGVLALGAWWGRGAEVSAQGRAPTRTAPAAPPFNQERALAELRKRIAGQEERPAAEVFQNIQLLKNLTAGRLLRIMEVGYARSLGVNCTHCHVAGEWEREEKPAKQVAREMAKMVGLIRGELKKMPSLKSKYPAVNCTTCHRGEVKPAASIGSGAG